MMKHREILELIGHETCCGGKEIKVSEMNEMKAENGKRGSEGIKLN